MHTQTVFTGLRLDLLHRFHKEADMREQALPHLVPSAIDADRAARGLLGMIAVISDWSQVVHTRRHQFVPNASVTWGAVRDVPPGHFPGSGEAAVQRMHRQGAILASLATAHWAEGRMHLPFAAQPLYDLRRRPYATMVIERVTSDRNGHRRVDPQEQRPASADPYVLDSGALPQATAAFLHVNEWMTRTAFFGRDDRGRPLVEAWHPLRPRGNREQDGGGGGWCTSVRRPPSWMPRPHLKIDRHTADGLFDLLSEAEVAEEGWICGHCHTPLTQAQFARAGAAVVFEDGNFAAPCPLCRQRGRWDEDKVVPLQVRRQFPEQFMLLFLEAVAAGLPLYLPLRATYAGVIQGGRASRPPAVGLGGAHSAPELEAHVFVKPGGEDVLYFLPRGARVHVEVGGEVASGTLWAHALVPEIHQGGRDRVAAWQRRHLRERWAALPRLCGGARYVAPLQRLALQHQGVEIAPAVLFPAALIASVVSNVPNDAIVWDFAKADQFLLGQERAFVFPPVHIGEWTKLCVETCGVAVDARVTHPCFREEFVATELEEHPFSYLRPTSRPSLRPLQRRRVSANEILRRDAARLSARHAGQQRSCRH